MHLLDGGSGVSVAAGTGVGDAAGIGVTWAWVDVDKSSCAPSINKTADTFAAAPFLTLLFIIQISTFELNRGSC